MNIAEANFLYNFISPLHNETANSVFIFISFLFNNGYLPIIIGLILSFSKKHRKTGIRILIALLIGLIVGNIILKPLVARPRPYEFLNILPIIAIPHDYSFPSGHTQAAFAFASAIFISNKKYGFLTYFLALTVAFSRIYLLVHYPTDIIVGMILGILWGYISETILRNLNFFGGTH